MPIDQKILDEILELTAKQVLAELRAAVEAGEQMDPRRLKNAMDLIERADARAFQAKEPEMIVDRSTGEVRATPLAPIFKTKASRDKLRKLLPLYLNAGDCAILNSFAEEDGAELVLPRTEISRDERDGEA